MNGKYKLGDLGLCRIAHVSHREDVTEGDSKYLAKEILSTLDETELPDLTKADIFSLGMTLYELVTMQELPNTGELWHQLRQGYIQANLNNYE
jgi:serine/threonine protein kinase